jgi:hypothetical protein
VDTNNDSPLGVASVFLFWTAFFGVFFWMGCVARQHDERHIPPPAAPIQKPAPPPCYLDLGQKLPDVSLARLILRKVHLVRPDLIPYPLFIEVYA